MSQPRENSDRTNEPVRARPMLPGCWFCQRPNVSGKTTLGSRTGSDTTIPICAPDTGCQDGRVYHGPPNDLPPHRPEESCEVCTADKARKMRANTGPGASRRDTGTRGRQRR